MDEFADPLGVGSLPWQWSVAAILCWGIILCLSLIFAPVGRSAPARAKVGERRPSSERRRRP